MEFQALARKHKIVEDDNTVSLCLHVRISRKRGNVKITGVAVISCNQVQLITTEIARQSYVRRPLRRSVDVVNVLQGHHRAFFKLLDFVIDSIPHVIKVLGAPAGSIFHLSIVVPDLAAVDARLLMVIAEIIVYFVEIKRSLVNTEESVVFFDFSILVLDHITLLKNPVCVTISLVP
jgi:hypothetical protein